ncbi:MAG TPA: cytochrome c [Terriglobia bacterium]|nr:cytochrome c [Terriglobia bacterium]
MAKSFSAASLALLVLAACLLLGFFGWRKYLRLVTPRWELVAGASPRRSPAGSVSSEPGAQAEPPLPKNRAEAALQNPIPASTDSLERGRRAYLTYCSVCHGVEGQGDGPLAVKAVLPPPNLAAVTGRRSDGYLYATIRNGGAIMPPLGSQIPPAERWDIVNYLRSIAAAVPVEMPVSGPAPARAAPAAPSQADGEAGSESTSYQGEAARGKAVFEAHCALCHDPSSDAQIVGPGLKRLFHWPPHQLSDGTEHAAHDEDIIRRQIVEGGGSMAPVGAALSAEELADLIAYLRTL